MAFIEIRTLTMKYGNKVAVDDLSLDIEEGELFGLLGPNGAGKTTTINTLCGLLTVQQGGEVRIGGRVIAGDALEVKKTLGLVPQEIAIYDFLTAEENVAFFGRLYGLKGQQLRVRASEALEETGLADRARGQPRTFSSGMKRRLNIACAIVHWPRLLVMDEPTVGIDPQSRSHILELVRRLNRKGTTVIYTSHYMEEVEALCRRVGIIDQGRLVACDNLDRLIQMLPGLIRVELNGSAAALEARLAREADLQVSGAGAGVIEVAANDMKAALVRVVSSLNETGAELVHLETREPNLERVFLHLTGRELRD